MNELFNPDNLPVMPLYPRNLLSKHRGISNAQAKFIKSFNLPKNVESEYLRDLKGLVDELVDQNERLFLLSRIREVLYSYLPRNRKGIDLILEDCNGYFQIALIFSLYFLEFFQYDKKGFNNFVAVYLDSEFEGQLLRFQENESEEDDRWISSELIHFVVDNTSADYLGDGKANRRTTLANNIRNMMNVLKKVNNILLGINES